MATRVTRKTTSTAKPAAKTTTTTKAAAKKPAARPVTFDVLPHDGDPGQRWDLHQKGARKHEYFRTQKEAVDAAWAHAGRRHARVVLHARDGHAYREFAH